MSWEAMSERERDAWISHNIFELDVVDDYNLVGQYAVASDIAVSKYYRTYPNGYCYPVPTLPKYTSDISAVMEAEEKIMQIGLADAYGNNLSRIVWQKAGRPIGAYDIAHASTADRCAAMYLTLNQRRQER
jgi:hypothetical protein